eukprot:3641483-Prymnesium_polylepis.1
MLFWARVTYSITRLSHHSAIHGLSAQPRGRGGCETSTGVIGAATRRKGVRGVRWSNVVIALIRGWIWKDLTLFPSGSSVRMGVSS